MKILYHAQGKTRKELANAISTITGAAKVYQGIPSYAYEIDCFTVDRDGNLNFDDSTDIKNLLEKLDSMGFHVDPAEPIEKEPDDSASKQENIDDLVIAMPRSFFTDTALENLKKLIQAKSNLMLKVFQIDVLRMQVTEDKVLFPWFTGCLDADTVKAYTHFIQKEIIHIIITKTAHFGGLFVAAKEVTLLAKIETLSIYKIQGQGFQIQQDHGGLCRILY